MPKSSIISSVKNTYNTISEEFSATRQYIWPDLKPFLNKVKSGSSVLDIGCGNGRLLLGLPKKIKYTGLDISDKLLKEAEKANPEHKFIETDITKSSIWHHLPQYDYIFCVAVMHHLPTQKEHTFVLGQIKKHLKPKGSCLLTVWNLWQPQYLKHHLDLKAKIHNLHHVYIPFQGKPRFCFAFTKPYIKMLLSDSKLDFQVKNTQKNYLIFN